MESINRIEKLKTLVKNFNRRNDTEKFATLLMVPKLLQNEKVTDEDLTEVFKCIGFKFIKKLLNNNDSKHCWLYRQTAVNILLVYSKLPVMVKEMQGLKERLCQLVCIIDKADTHANQCNKDYNGDIDGKMRGMSIEGECEFKDEEHDGKKNTRNSGEVEQDSVCHSTESTPENIQEEKTKSPPAPLSSLNQIKHHIYQILINMITDDRVMMMSYASHVSEMMITSCAHHMDDEAWQLTTTLLVQLLAAGSTEVCPVLLSLLDAVFKESNSVFIMTLVDYLANVLPCLNKDQQQALNACSFYHVLTTHLTSLHSSKIAQEHKDKCLVLSCRVVNQLRVEYFLNNNTNNNNNNNNNNTNKNKNNDSNNKNNNFNNNNKETFLRLILRLATMEIMLALDSDHHPKTDRRVLLEECVGMYEGLVCCDVEFVQDHLYEVLHHVLQFIKEIEDFKQQEITWWHKTLLRFTAACMCEEWGLDEGVLDALSSILNLCGKACVLDGPNVMQQHVLCCLHEDDDDENNIINNDNANKEKNNDNANNHLENNDGNNNNNSENITDNENNVNNNENNINKENNNNNENNNDDDNNSNQNTNKDNNNNNSEDILLMITRGLGQMTHVEEVRVVMMVDGGQVMKMIFELYARKLFAASPPPLLHVMIADITCNIVFNTIEDLPRPMVTFLLFLAHVLPKEKSLMPLGELISFAAAVLLLATKKKLQAPCKDALKKWSYITMKRYEEEVVNDDDTNFRAYEIACQEYLKLP